MKSATYARLGSCLLVLALASTAARAPGQQQTVAATRQYNTAVGLHNSEVYDLAAEEWIKFLTGYRKDPRADRAWHYLGVCYLKQDKLEKAAETFETVVKFFPNSKLLDDTLLNLGLAQYNIAQGGKTDVYDKAAATFHTLAEKYPRGKHVPTAMFFGGECLYHRGKKEEAVKQYAAVVEKHPTHAAAARSLFALAVTQADLNRHKQALATYDLFLKKFAKNPLAAEVTMWRGETLYALKRHAEAIEAYTAAAAAPGFAMADYATVRRADALFAMKKYAEAADVFASVPAKFPKSQYVGLCNLEAGKKYYSAGDFPNAHRFLTKVVAAGGESAPEAAHWVAKSLLKQDKPAEALTVVENVLPSARKSSFAAALLMDQADAMYEIPKRRGNSVALYAAAASQHPDAPEAPQALYMAALAAMNLHDYATAATHADAFMAAHADHELAVGARHVLAESNLLLGKYAEAEARYNQLLAKASDDRDAEIWKVHRGTAMYLQKKHRQTIDTLTPVMREIRTPALVAEGWYRIGRSQAALREYPAAVKSLNASLAAAPKWKLADDTHVVLAYAYQQTQDFAKAKEHAGKVIAEFASGDLLDRAHYRLGECARLSGDLKTAVAEYRLVLKKYPKSTLKRQTLFGLGWAQVGAKDYAGAETSFTALIDTYPDDKLAPRARYGRGMARQQLKKFGPAAEDIQAMLPTASPSEKSRALHVLGLSQKGLKQFADAAKTFRALLAEDPDYGDADSIHFELGWSLKSMGSEDEAAGVFASLAEQYPDSSLAADAQCLVGDHAYEKKQYRKAAAAYSAAMKKAGKSKLGEEAGYKLGLAYYLQDDWRNALQAFRHQRRTWPDGPLADDGTFMAAECLLKQQKYKEALAAYERVNNPTDKDIGARALLHASQAAAQLKRWDKCLELAAALTAKFPDAPQAAEAFYHQGWAQQNLGNSDEAVKLYEQVLAKTDLEPAARAQFMIGEIQFEQKKHQDAVRSYFKVAYGYGYPKWQAYATYEAGRCFEVRGQKSQAVKQYRKLVEDFPESDKVPLAKERLEALE